MLAERIADSTPTYDTKILYGTSIAESIIDGAHEVDAIAFVFTPRGGSEWMKLLTEDVTAGLISESDVPILILPDVTEE